MTLYSYSLIQYSLSVFGDVAMWGAEALFFKAYMSSTGLWCDFGVVAGVGIVSWGPNFHNMTAATTDI